MLEIVVPEQEYFNENINTFINIKETRLQLEHSLISLHKWEAKTHKPFLGTDKSMEEIIEYIKCMTIGRTDPNLYNFLPASVFEQIIAYIKDPMSATWFKDLYDGLPNSKGRNGVVTAEIIYYWMISLNIPVEFERWHLCQLLTLIKVINEKNAPKKKMSAKEAQVYRDAENMRRRAALKSKG